MINTVGWIQKCNVGNRGVAIYGKWGVIACAKINIYLTGGKSGELAS